MLFKSSWYKFWQYISQNRYYRTLYSFASIEDAISSTNVPISVFQFKIFTRFFFSIKFLIMCIFCTISEFFPQLQDSFIVILLNSMLAFLILLMEHSSMFLWIFSILNGWVCFNHVISCFSNNSRSQFLLDSVRVTCSWIPSFFWSTLGQIKPARHGGSVEILSSLRQCYYLALVTRMRSTATHTWPHNP